MNKVVFRNCAENSLYWNALEKLFQTEWSDFLFADTYKSEAHLPPVLVALRDNEVIGGLAYSWYQEPHGNTEVIWVNALFVSPKWRGQGIASELINRGVNQVSETLQNNLYAYTNAALLYKSLGWSVVDIECEPNHRVVSISLKPQPRI
ncbi:TPA: GNAT family N-acetyltransferase [Vibrio parahaemolyticus]|uniref:GNAT family N-acetyltransferase n=1 Tax=Vibrio parahaemolyticus TaxID=670 RepID=A0A9Q3UK16_VIBPH|nr:GNAT family N-acetyltransferase [Vibrio parahaemolyticus]EGQ7800918.1 GNAT family N-acetyltransferase [Vibrio parahaemolyticus]EGQ8113003.1 GNAT family N-acetyltransferase [Vibrio parahaemolyticus]EGQ8200766.1 GNAT family N-acetyltransferase [Vibrio parahaemolyticus]EGQ8551531.1 GNAT family N-acetyltransferase [Vibrio parahaemolyticus]EGQ9075240.1 GNAT family N-acetyltransferase [Vibrio parahaemolyticus]